MSKLAVVSLLLAVAVAHAAIRVPLTKTPVKGTSAYHYMASKYGVTPPPLIRPVVDPNSGNQGPVPISNFENAQCTSRFDVSRLVWFLIPPFVAGGGSVQTTARFRSALRRRCSK
jgi:hypothetical protein